ncbi:MAG: hypothetical protein KBD78_07695 [Oligoflexales bacterium]|nr:hypothetical protein [Oligoflexales bacterium]
MEQDLIQIVGARHNNLKNLNLSIHKNSLTVITGVSGSGKSSLAFDILLNESYRMFFSTLNHFSRQGMNFSQKADLDKIIGLPPAIGLTQRETSPSRRASVGSFSDISELLGVLFANYGQQFCPKHKLALSSGDVDKLIDNLIQSYSGQMLCIVASLAESKTGSFREVLQGLSEKGFNKILLNGELVELTPLPVLERHRKHSIKLIVDLLKLGPDSSSRLNRSLQLGLQEGAGFVEYALVKDPTLKNISFEIFSKKAGCPKCSFSWPKLDSRHFSANSLGRCSACQGLGFLESEDSDNEQNKYLICEVCQGVGLDIKFEDIKIAQKSISEFYLMTISELQKFFESIPKKNSTSGFSTILEQILLRIEAIQKVNLSYLKISRRLISLSNGEYQRLRFSGILSSKMHGVLYVVDEPSQGLHPSELKNIIDTLRVLIKDGNTVVVVDHDESIMLQADWIIDLGPSGGEEGGYLVEKFQPKDAKRYYKSSATARYLTDAIQSSKLVQKEKIRENHVSDTQLWFEFSNLNCNNLKIPKIKFPIQKITVVTGVSGAGKNSLVVQTVFENVKEFLKDRNLHFSPIFCAETRGLDFFDEVFAIDRSPPGKNTKSMPVTYLDIWKDIRTLFSSSPESQILGLNERYFSLHTKEGRCAECLGHGTITKKVKFLLESEYQCQVCKGKRFSERVLSVKYLGKSISDILDFTIDNAIKFFANHRRIVSRLEPAQQIGLGYIKLGQTLNSLSGGEAQRLKMLPILLRKFRTTTLLLLDEPTLGLHALDAEKLLHFIVELQKIGITIIIIESDARFIQACDWLIEIGPGSGVAGGNLLSACWNW